MCKPGKRIRTGDHIVFADGELQGTFGEFRENGLRLLEVESSETVEALLERHGRIPLPPYINRRIMLPTPWTIRRCIPPPPGRSRHQPRDSISHSRCSSRIASMGVEILKITLHVGIGTFLPVRTDDPRNTCFNRNVLK